MPNTSVFQSLADSARQHGTPLWCYEAETIRSRINQLQGFDGVRYAQKACSNLHILRLIREQGVRIDAVSLGKSSGHCWLDSALAVTRPALFLPVIYSMKRHCTVSWNCKWK